MNKKQLINALQNEYPIHKRTYKFFVEELTDIIKDELEKGEEVRLVGFGTFKVKIQPARKGVNPRTKESISIPSKKIPVFSPGKKLKEITNESS